MGTRLRAGLTQDHVQSGLNKWALVGSFFYFIELLNLGAITSKAQNSEFFLFFFFRQNRCQR